MFFAKQYKPDAQASELAATPSPWESRPRSGWRGSGSLNQCNFSMILAFILIHCLASQINAQEIILRDLTQITDAKITSVDDESLQLADGKQLSWDAILQARVDPVWQNLVDSRIEKYGLPLYRLKHRLRQKNFAGAFEIARQWYDSDQQKFSGIEANFLVCRSVMLGRIGRGENALAIEPMIRAIELQEECSPEFLNSNPDLAFSKSELKTELCNQLLPVWGSVEQTVSQLNQLESQFDLQQLSQKWPGLAVYLSSMAVHSSQRERMIRWNAAMGGVPQLRPWQRVLNSDLSRTPLSILIRDAEGPLRISTMYLWATAEDQQASKSDRVLALLKIAANYQDEFPTLAKESLDRAVELTDDPDQKTALIGR